MVSKEAEMRAVLEAYEQWEADWIMDDESWPIETTAAMSKRMYDRFIEIQGMRNKALGRFQKTGDPA